MHRTAVLPICLSVRFVVVVVVVVVAAIAAVVVVVVVVVVRYSYVCMSFFCIKVSVRGEPSIGGLPLA